MTTKPSPDLFPKPTTPNPDLTDAECDKILVRMFTDMGMTLLVSRVEHVDWELYRRSQHATFAQAFDLGGIVGMYNIRGYAKALDALCAVEHTANLLNHGAADTDLRVIIYVNREPLPECWLGETVQQMKRHLIRQGWYTLNT